MFDFDRETAAREVAEGRYQGRLSRHWNIGENPNGGYLAAIALRVMAGAARHPDPISVTTHYLRPGLAGEAYEVRVDAVRSGRQVSTLRASLRQRDKICLEVLAAFGDLGRDHVGGQELTIPAPVIPAPDQCPARSARAQGVHLPILDRLDVRLDPGPGEPSGRQDGPGKARVGGWIRLRDGRPPDTLALGLFVDAFPPSLLAVFGNVGWVPTLELTVHARARPAPGWLQGQFITRDLSQGRMIEEGLLWDSSGVLVAQSRQLGLVIQRD